MGDQYFTNYDDINDKQQKNEGKKGSRMRNPSGSAI